MSEDHKKVNIFIPKYFGGGGEKQKQSNKIQYAGVKWKKIITNILISNWFLSYVKYPVERWVRINKDIFFVWRIG